MQKRSSKPKRPRDLNQLAKRLVDEATGQAAPESKPDREKNPAAVALGRLGGLKGGNVRAERLSQRRRTQIARRAANIRWKNIKTESH